MQISSWRCPERLASSRGDARIAISALGRTAKCKDSLARSRRAPTRRGRPPHRLGTIPGAQDISATRSARSAINIYAVLHPDCGRYLEIARDCSRLIEIAGDLGRFCEIQPHTFWIAERTYFIAEISSVPGIVVRRCGGRTRQPTPHSCLTVEPVRDQIV